MRGERSVCVKDEYVSSEGEGGGTCQQECATGECMC